MNRTVTPNYASITASTLEVVAKIMAYYGEDFIKIPLKDLNFYSIGDGKK